MKKFFSVLLATIALTCLCACGASNKSEEAKDDEQIEAKQPVRIEVNCNSNLFFSRYDLRILVDDTELGTLDHGTSNAYETELTEGKHTLAIQKRDDASVDGLSEFEVQPEEMVVSCTVACTSSQVEIKDFKAITKAEKELAEREAEEQAKREEEGKQTEATPQTTEEEKALESEESEEHTNTASKPDKNAEQTDVPITTADPTFAAFLTTENTSEISSFVSSHQGRTIEFDGYIANIMHHESYSTRYDFLIYVGDSGSAIGPMFKIEDAGISDLKLSGNVPDSLHEGMNIRIKARLIEYNSVSGLCMIDPEETSLR